MDNYETMLNAERRKVVRHFQRYTSEQRANLGASHRNIGRLKKIADGEYFYTHPDVPGSGFGTRTKAAEAAIRIKEI